MQHKTYNIIILSVVAIALISMAIFMQISQSNSRLKNQPIEAIVVADRSGSFKDKVYLIDQVCNDLSARLQPNDSFVLFRMATSTELIYQNSTMPSSEDWADAVVEQFQSIKPPKKTLPEKAFEAVLEYIEQNPTRKKIVIFVTDGENDDLSHDSDIHLLHICQEMGNKKNVLGVGMMGVEAKLKQAWSEKFEKTKCAVEIRGTSDIKDGLRQLIKHSESRLAKEDSNAKRRR